MTRDTSAISQNGQMQIEVFGADLDGYQFIEQTQTLSITRDGATIGLANKLAPDSELIVRNPATNKEATARVVDLIRVAVFVHVYGIAFVDPSVKFWDVEFPESDSAKPMLLECSRCHAVDKVSPSEIEMEIFASKKSLSRYCECSNSSTIWTQTDRRATDRRAKQREVDDRRMEIPQTPEPSPQTRVEKRKEKRTAMKVQACIRYHRGEVVVECENISRGGFRFKSHEKYPAGMLIEVAIPYAKGSVNIFVAARTAYQQELSSGVYRHGVTYVKSLR